MTLFTNLPSVHDRGHGERMALVLELRDRQAVAYMPKLTTLSLSGNPLLFPPPGVLTQGDAAVLDFIQRHRYADMLSVESER